MTRRWLVKSEPSEYAFDDLVQDGHTRWEGVTNALARKHLAAMAPGDAVLVYHTGSEKAVVGTATVGVVEGGDVDLVAGPRLPRPVPLAEIKADPKLAGWELVRISRLSVMPVTDGQWKIVLARAAKPPKPAPAGRPAAKARRRGKAAPPAKSKGRPGKRKPRE